MNYPQYLLSEEWCGTKGKRIRRLDIDKYECRICGSHDQLEVHHKPDSYKKIPHESVEDDLTTLCHRHHAVITNDIREQRYKSQEITIEIHESKVHKRSSEVTKNAKLENPQVPPYRRLPPYRP